MNTKIKKSIVLFALFIVPLLFYILLSSGINNFAKLPIVTPNVIDVSSLENNEKIQFKKNISIVCFLGNNPDQVKGGFFNLNQKMYKPFYGFKDYQIVVLTPKGTEKAVLKLKKELGAFTDMVKWKFVFANANEIKVIYDSFKTNDNLDENLYSPKAFIVDKDVSLRGRTDDKESMNGKLFGYNMHSVAELNNKMKDDLKIVLAEYRLALKKNDADREI